MGLQWFRRSPPSGTIIRRIARSAKWGHGVSGKTPGMGLRSPLPLDLCVVGPQGWRIKPTGTGESEAQHATKRCARSCLACGVSDRRPLELVDPGPAKLPRRSGGAEIASSVPHKSTSVQQTVLSECAHLKPLKQRLLLFASLVNPPKTKIL